MAKNLQQIVDAHDWEASGEQLSASMRPLHTQLVELGAAEASNQLASAGLPEQSYHVRREELDGVVDLLADQVKGISDTTRQRIQTIVDTQNREGLSIPQTTDLLKSGMGIDSTRRARMIARTETASAYNMGSLLTYGKAGIEQVLVHDGDIDADCAAANGQIWTVEEAAANPIAHPNCRRFFSPIVATGAMGQPEPQGQVPSGGPASEAEEMVAVGIPLSQEISIPGKGSKLGKQMQRTLDAIASVHHDGQLPAISVTSSSGSTTLGQYRYYLSTGKPDGIRISSKGEHQELTAAHEIGHFLDHQAIGQTPGKYATTSKDPIMAAFQQAAEGSDALQSMLALKGQSTVPITLPDGSQRTAYIDQTYLRYLTSDVEVWARAYAQYIAVKSGDPVMLEQLGKEQRSSAVSPYKGQWSDEDFAPIAEAIDQVMVQQGWRMKK